MEFIEFLKNKGALLDVVDEYIYEFIAAELESGSLKKGLWTKALADADWAESLAKASYVRMRYAQIKKSLDEEKERALASADPVMMAKREALEFGLESDEIEYLGVPIKAIRYLEKYRVSRDEIALACAQKEIKHVMCKGVLWVSDKRIR